MTAAKKIGKASKVKRKSLRFSPDQTAYAQIDLEGHCTDDSFDPSIVALITDEAYKGCGLVMLNTDALKVGDQCALKVGKIGPIMAEVKWREEIDSRVIKVGFLFLE